MFGSFGKSKEELDEKGKIKKVTLTDFTNMFQYGCNDIKSFCRENETEDEAKIRLLITFASRDEILKSFILYLMKMGVAEETATQYADDIKEIVREKINI